MTVKQNASAGYSYSSTLMEWNGKEIVSRFYTL